MCYIIFYQKIYIVFTVQTTRQNIANTPSGLCYYQNFLILTLLLNIIILSIFLNVNNFCKLFLKFVILKYMVLLFTFISYKVFKSIIKNNLQPWRVLVLIRERRFAAQTSTRHELNRTDRNNGKRKRNESGVRR